MIVDLIRDKVKPKAYRTLLALFGEPKQVTALRDELGAALRQQEQERARTGQQLAELERALELCRQERLEWRAKEAATRKDLQDSQARNNDLLEQVVNLTHQKRASVKDLLDQKFKTEAMPLERTRFELELTEARGRVRRAEERTKVAEERLARNQVELKPLRQQAGRAKQLESDLAWTRQQSAAHLQALGAAVLRIRSLEAELEQARAVPPPRLAYRRPAIRKARQALADRAPAPQPAPSDPQQ